MTSTSNRGTRVPHTEQVPFETRRRNAMVASWQGLFLDFIDIFAPVIALAPALMFFTSPEMSAAEKTMIYYLTFFATLIGRPLGSLIFGTIADRFGRRIITLVSVAGFTVCTLAIGLLPGYETLGILAPILLIVLRFVDGIFLGGEYTSATPMAFEFAQKEKRGLFGGILQSAYPASYVTVSAATLLVFLIAPVGDINSPYVQWGWRIVFITSALASAVFFFYRFNHLPESDVWEKTKKATSPLRQVMFGQFRKDFWQTFGLMSGLWFLSAATVSVIPPLLLGGYGISSTTVTWIMLIAHALLAAVFIAVGSYSQRVGRRRLLVGLGITVATVAAGLSCLLASKLITSPFWVGLLVVAVVVTAISPWGVSLAYCNERFATNVRSTGFGVAYSLSIIIPSLYPFYSVWLGAFIPVEYASAVCYIVGGLLIVVGALAGPETKDVDLSSIGSRDIDVVQREHSDAH